MWTDLHSTAYFWPKEVADFVEVVFSSATAVEALEGCFHILHPVMTAFSRPTSKLDPFRFPMAQFYRNTGFSNK